MAYVDGWLSLRVFSHQGCRHHATTIDPELPPATSSGSKEATPQRRDVGHAHTRHRRHAPRAGHRLGAGPLGRHGRPAAGPIRGSVARWPPRGIPPGSSCPGSPTRRPGTRVHLVPPFQQVLVQAKPPVPGRTYNVLSVAVRNHTSRTFTAQDHFSVRLSGQSHATPILTGDEQWKPGQFMVFYVLTHQYYPAHPVVSGGFEFDLDGSTGVAIPGPSGIFLRLPYRPATFARDARLDHRLWPGHEGGLGPRYGLPDTQIWEFQ